MRVNQSLILSKSKHLSAILLAGMITHANTNDVSAQNLDADFVLNEMTIDQRASYIAGLLEGLAFARWHKDKPDFSGSRCIKNWYDRDTKLPRIKDWFTRHPDKQPGPLLYILVKQDCGGLD